MPSSSSSSSVRITGITSPGSVDPVRVRAPDDTIGGSDDDTAAAALSWPLTERITSCLRTQDAVDALCKKHSVPREFTALPAGDRRACTPPPPGAICVYAHSLEAGMRVPLHAFFCEALSHYGLAPSQLAPNGWRVLVGFVVLCHDAGVRPSLAVFQHFFSLSISKLKGWYFFRCKDAAVVLFTGLPKSPKGWKEGFFFLSSPAPWPCPVRWGEPPSKSATTDPMLTGVEKKSVAKLLDAFGGAVDLRSYLYEINLAAAFSSNPSCASPPPPSPPTTAGKGLDPSVYDMMQSMRAKKPAAAARKVKAEPEGDTLGLSPLSGKKRKQEEAEANAKEGLCRSEPSTLPAARCPAYVHAPPGFSAPKTPTSDQDRNPRHVPDGHDGDSADWEAARGVLQCIVTPSRERLFATAKPSDVVVSSYISVLQAANYASFSFGYALELEEKLMARERDAAAEAGALLEELEKAKAELAEAKRSAEAELEDAKAAAVQEFLGSEEYVRRLAEHALEGYERGMEDMKRVALRCDPRFDAARLVVPPGGPPR